MIQSIIIILISIILLIIVRILLGYKVSQIKEMKNNKKLNDITDKMPENIEVCKSILKMLDNEKVQIEETENTETSLYIAVTDKITIGNIKNNFFRIQTIAHECLHSIQNRKLLMFNFIFSNIYLLYFAIICILTLFNVINNAGQMCASILLLMGIIQYYIRDILEQEAMQKAPFLAKRYMEENNLCSKEEVEEIMQGYHSLNKVGIPAAQFSLLAKNIVKFIIYEVFCLLFIV